MSARDDVLARIRQALGDRSTTPDMRPVIPRDYRGAGATVVADPISLLADRIEDYRATVHRCAEPGVADMLGGLLGGGPVVVPDGFPAAWLPPTIDVRRDDPALTTAELDRATAVLTTCAVAIALTGTIVLDHGPGQGRRALTLVPDHHVVIVRADQVVPGVPDAVAALDPTRPLTWISGPSATSDIELERVEGVHGPRRLDVVIVG